MCIRDSAYEKRGTANFVPMWIPDNCIQCNQCSFVCPHAVVRPFLVSEEEVKKAPEGTLYLTPTGKGLEGLKYSLQISTLDCTGCEAVSYTHLDVYKRQTLSSVSLS